MRSLGVAVLASLLLASCGNREPANPSRPSPAPVVASATPADVPAPTQAAESPPPLPAPANATSVPTMTPTAQPTPSPSQAPEPAATPSATATPTSERSSVQAPGPRILPNIQIPFLTPTVIPADELPNVLDRIGSRVSTVRELPELRPVDRDLITREDLAQRLREDFEESREEFQTTQQIYVTLGIMEQGADLYAMLLGLYGEAVLGFYTPEDEKFFVVSEASRFGPPEERTYAHEYVHGLQQQHFDIFAISESLEGNSDAGAAFSALVEGDASLGEDLYVTDNMTRSQRVASIPPSSQELFDAFRASPNVIQRSLIFPYREGQSFVESLFVRKRWETVNEAYEELPKSTEQVLHPEKYFAQEDPQPVELPDLGAALGDGWTEVERDTMGEFFVMVYLESGIPSGWAALAAEGWGGDRYTYWSGPEDRQVLVSSLVWDTPEDAREFHDAFVGFTGARGDLQPDPIGANATTTLMTLPDQVVLVERESDTTVLVFAPDPEVLDRVREALQQFRGG